MTSTLRYLGKQKQKNYEEEEEGTIAVEPVLALSPIEFFPEHGIEH